eukprot:4590948-Pyramimonas_sp.AAC.1
MLGGDESAEFSELHFLTHRAGRRVCGDVERRWASRGRNPEGTPVFAKTKSLVWRSSSRNSKNAAARKCGCHSSATTWRVKADTVNVYVGGDEPDAEGVLERGTVELGWCSAPEGSSMRRSAPVPEGVDVDGR